MMKKAKAAGKTGFILYGVLMLCIPAVLYLEIHGYIAAGIALVVLMFAISMGMLWVSEAEEGTERRASAPEGRVRQRG